MAGKFSELEAKMSNDAIEKSDILYLQLRESMVLEELAGEKRVTQNDLGESLKVEH